MSTPNLTHICVMSKVAIKSSSNAPASADTEKRSTASQTRPRKILRLLRQNKRF
jgi:hypothetical protein